MKLEYIWFYFVSLLYQVCQVLFQKLWMRHLGDVDEVCGPCEGVVAIVTGPTSGIGRETAACLSRKGATVVLACRSLERGTKVKRSIEEDAAAAGRPLPKVEVELLDLASMESVRQFVARWESKQRPLHILINNAGIFSMGAPREETVDGFESHIASNHLGHFLLTLGLIPALTRGTAARPGYVGRVVSVSSSMHAGAVRGMAVADPHMRRTPYGSEVAYSQSKLAQILFTRELRRRLHAAGLPISAFAVHPGMVLTDVSRTLPRWMQDLQGRLMTWLLLTPKEGARASVYCATNLGAIPAADVSDGYFDASCVPVQPWKPARSTLQATWLWRWSADTVALPPQWDLPAGPK